MEKENNFGAKFIVLLVGILIAFTLFTCESRQRIGAKCRDGTSSSAIGSGACSHHKGVKYWKYKYWWE
jgi:hypothetical protein